MKTRDVTGKRPEPVRRTPSAGLVAWAMYDWGSSAFSTIILTFVFAAYFTRSVAENERVGTALWGNTLSIAGIIVVIAGPILGAVADQRGRHKPWIAAFTLLSAGATALLWFVRPAPDYLWPALILLGVGSLGEELAFIFYNAMLPQLVPQSHIGRWSGWGWSAGYIGGLLCLTVALLAFVQTNNPWFPLERASAQDVRATFLLAAGWYLLFALPLFLLTPDTPRTDKPAHDAVRDGLRQLRNTFGHIRRYRPIVHFLIARMIYIDGLATLFAFGGVYAAGTFDMTEQEVLLFGIVLNIAAGLGAIGFAWIDDWIGSKSTILLSLVGLIVPGTLILMVESQQLFWTLGILLGVFVGPVQAASRSFLARAAPKELQNEMFGLYALSGKATAFLGPLTVGWLTYLSGSQRIGMGAIIGLFVIGLLLMLTVPVSGKGESSA